MPTVAEQLRNAREKRNLTIVQGADATKIRSDHLRALEEGNYDIFAAPVYIRGFVRTYGQLLKMDLARLMADLDGELSQTKQFAEAPSLGPGPKGFVDQLMLLLSRLNWKVTAPLVLLLLLLGSAYFGYRAWTNYRKENPLKELGPGMYKGGSNSSGAIAPIPAPPPNRH